MHYQRWRKTGDPLRTKSGKTRAELDDVIANFWKRVDKTDDCWWWTGATNGGRYGKIRASGVYVGAHRLSYQIHRGEIPDGIFVCHTCDHPQCVNPAHLFLGTHSDNMKDMVAKNRRYRDPRTGQFS